MNNKRYARLEQMDWWDQVTVSSAQVLVVGAGALGNEVVKNLCLSGIGHIVIVDSDVIEMSNLTRSVFYREEDIGQSKAAVLAKAASAMNPDCKVTGIHADIRLAIGSGTVSRMDLVLGCLDNIDARLAINDLAGQADRLFIDGGLSIWEGTVSTFLASSGTCYACGLSEDDFRFLNLRHSCPAYAKRAATATGVPTTATLASITGGFMVQQALKWIHGQRLPPRTILGSQIRIETESDHFWKLGLPRNPDCALHPQKLTIEICGLHSRQDWSSIYQYWIDRLETSQISLHLPISVLESWSCPTCGLSTRVHQASSNETVLRCTCCESAAIPSFTNQITGQEGWLHLSPEETKFPPLSWITVVSNGTDEIHFEIKNPSSLDKM